VEHGALGIELDRLVAETYKLWDPGWVTFNWRNYTYDHVQRVRGLTMMLCSREGGDPAVCELASLLHDITKPYDGEYLVNAEGKRVVDAGGYWRNVPRPPARHNEVTELYDALGLAGELHNVSGAAVARSLLRRRSVDDGICERVARGIRDHLKPPDDAPVESRCLSDADTIDANIGLPAFVRNIYIHLHFRDQRLAPGGVPTDRLIHEMPLEYLRPYFCDDLPRWSEGKRRDFIPRLMTDSGVRIAEERLGVLTETWARLREELGAFPVTSRRGATAAVLHLMRHRDDPSISAEAAYLSNEWLVADSVLPEGRAFVERLQREIAGLS
jgi:putative nucleotidyltransferase with HDIG domain